MKSFLLLPAFFAMSVLARGASLDRSTITQVVKDVRVMAAGTKKMKAAGVGDAFAVPDVLRTGPDSRAEMIAPDQTVTRVGANTIFQFAPGKREVLLQQGSLLFNAPGGQGGGTIKTAAATASVLGTTLIVSTTRNGGFKVLLLEGRGKVSTGRESRTLNAGELVFALPGGSLSTVRVFDLERQVGSALLVKGYRKTLPSLPKIEAAIVRQEKAISSGKMARTQLLAGDDPGSAYQVVEVALDSRRGAKKVMVGDEEKVVVVTPTGEVEDEEVVLVVTLSDVEIDAATLEDARIYALGSDPELDAVFAGVTAQTALPESLTLFAGENVTVNARAVDLRAFEGSGGFALLATKDLKFSGDTFIGGLNGEPVVLIAGDEIGFASADAAVTSFTLEATARNFVLLAVGAGEEGIDPFDADESFVPRAGGSPLVWNRVLVTNNTGNLSLFAPSADFTRVGLTAPGGRLALTLTGDFVVRAEAGNDGQIESLFRGAQRLTLTAGGGVAATAANFESVDLRVSAGGRVALLDSNFQGVNGTRADSIQINAGGDMDFGRVTFRANRVALNAAGNINAAGNSYRPNSQVAITAGGELRMSGTVNSRDVALTAQTIVLRNLTFRPDARVVLDSASGRLAPLPNRNEPVSLGDVNFIRNVNYGTAPAQDAVAAGLIIIR